MVATSEKQKRRKSTKPPPLRNSKFCQSSFPEMPHLPFRRLVIACKKRRTAAYAEARAKKEDTIWADNDHSSSSDSEHESFVVPRSLFIYPSLTNATDADVHRFFKYTITGIQHDWINMFSQVWFESDAATKNALKLRGKKLRGQQVMLHLPATGLHVFRIFGFEGYLTNGLILQQLEQAFVPYGQIVRMCIHEPEIDERFCYLYLRRNHVDMSPMVKEFDPKIKLASFLAGQTTALIRVGDHSVMAEKCDMKLRVNRSLLD